MASVWLAVALFVYYIIVFILILIQLKLYLWLIFHLQKLLYVLRITMKTINRYTKPTWCSRLFLNGECCKDSKKGEH